MESLDKILSGPGEAKPGPEVSTTVEDKAAPVVEQQAGTEPQDEVIEQGGRKMVPLEALTETRGKVKRYTEQVAEFERKLADQSTAFDKRMSEVLQAVRQPAPLKEAPPPTDWFENPEVAFNQRGQALINPVVGQLRTMATELAQMKAERVFGDKFSDFMTHVTEATKRGDPEVRALEAMMEASPQPYVVAKEWFEKRSFDPVAEREKMKAEILAELQGGTPPPVQTTVMPSNLAGARNVGARTGPAWAGPTPLTDIFKRD